AGDEKQAAGEHGPPARGHEVVHCGDSALAVGCGGVHFSSPVRRDVGPGQPGHVREVSGNERQHARGKEGDQSGGRGQRNGEEEGSGEDSLSNHWTSASSAATVLTSSVSSL